MAVEVSGVSRKLARWGGNPFGGHASIGHGASRVPRFSLAGVCI